MVNAVDFDSSPGWSGIDTEVVIIVNIFQFLLTSGYAMQ